MRGRGMRKQINENPVVQLALIGVMVLAFGFLLATRVMGGGGSASAPPPSTSSDDPAAGATATGSAPQAGSTPTAGVTPAEPAAPPTATAGFAAGRGLPKQVVTSYRRGETVVLLVHKARGLDDRAVRSAVEDLRERDEVALFVTRASGIARYSKITQGLAVDRVPALIVLRPRRSNEGAPQASVSYGFRSPDSILQAVRDAQYEGPTVPYHPE